MGSDQIGTKLNPRMHELSVTNFVFQFEPMIRNLYDTRYGKESNPIRPMLIFLSGNWPLFPRFSLTPISLVTGDGYLEEDTKFRRRFVLMQFTAIHMHCNTVGLL